VVVLGQELAELLDRDLDGGTAAAWLRGSIAAVLVVELLLLALSAVSLALVAALLSSRATLSVLPSLAGAVTTASGLRLDLLPASDAAAAWIGSRASGLAVWGGCDFDLLDGLLLAVSGVLEGGASPSAGAGRRRETRRRSPPRPHRHGTSGTVGGLLAVAVGLKADEAAGRDGRMGRRRGGCAATVEVDRVSIALSWSSPKVASVDERGLVGPVGLVPGAAASVFGAKAASMPSAVKAGLPLSAPNLAAARARSSARMASRSAGLMV